MPITPEMKVQCFDTVLTRLLGGSEVVEMLVQFHIEEKSYREIATIHGVTVEVSYRKIKTARKHLKACGIWPSEWRERKKVREAVAG